MQRPIPVWIGAVAEPALRRVGRLADGWFPQVPPGPKLDDAWGIVQRAAIDAGRDPATIGVDGRISWTADGGIDELMKHADRWRGAGASHLSINTMGAGLGSLDAHLDVLAQASEALAPLGGVAR